MDLRERNPFCVNMVYRVNGTSAVSLDLKSRQKKKKMLTSGLPLDRGGSRLWLGKWSDVTAPSLLCLGAMAITLVDVSVRKAQPVNRFTANAFRASIAGKHTARSAGSSERTPRTRTISRLPAFRMRIRRLPTLRIPRSPVSLEDPRTG